MHRSTISEHGSIEASVKSITASSGIVATLLPSPEKDYGPMKVVIGGGPRALSDPEDVKLVFQTVQDWVNSGKLVPNRSRVMPGGLNGVEEGWKLGIAGKVSGEKLVYRIADTKF